MSNYGAVYSANQSDCMYIFDACLKAVNITDKHHRYLRNRYYYVSDKPVFHRYIAEHIVCAESCKQGS